MGNPVGPPRGGTPVLPAPGQPTPMRPDEFASGATPNQTSFGFDLVGPPSPLYIQRDDQLVIVAITATAGGDTIAINGRFLLAPYQQGGQPSDARPGQPTGKVLTHGVIEPIASNLQVPTPFVEMIQVIQLTEGYLLGLAVVSQGAVTRGQTFVRAYINRGPAAAIASGASQLLFSDYTTRYQVVGWPGGRVQHGTEGPGNLRVITLGNPAAGADWLQSITPGARWRICSLNAALVTSAAVANRTPQIRLRHSGVTIWQSPPNQVIPASTTALVSAAPGQVTSATVPTLVNCALPSPAIIGGIGAADIAAVTGGMQAADQWTNINIEIEEWVDIL